MTRGDIHFVILPVPPQPTQPGGQPAANTVQQGPRPCVIAEFNGGNQNLSTVLVVPVTGNQKHNWPYSFFVQPSQVNGLDRPSTVLIHQLRAVDKRIVQRRIGRLDPADLRQFDTQLRAILNLPTT
jgi:mRNA-degrading endonuclease toxin of MazEF toxin-antitoxin module